MTSTYPFRAAVLLLAVAFPVFSESLEEKVSEARRLQAQSMSSSQQTELDSALNEKKLEVGQAQPAKKAAAKRHSRDRLVLDSLLSGPESEEYPQGQEADSLASLDSTGKPKAMRGQAKPAMLMRYEQRVFGSVNPAVFSSASGAVGRDYVLGPGDEVVVALWGDKEKEYPLTLNSDGKIFLEGIGVVALAGNNLDQALQAIKQRLAKVYSGIGRGTTHVDLTLGKAGPIRVFVLGDVRVPGGYVFTGHTSVLSALYFAKGPSNIGTVRNLQLTRSGNKFSLDLYRYLLKGETLSPNSLRDGDILFAGRAEVLVTIDGEVGRPAIFELKKGEGMKELLEFAGGLNSTAANQKMTLQRIGPTGTIDFLDLASPQDYQSGKAKIDLRDGDKVHVAKSTEPSVNYMMVTGPVKYPGTYSAEGIASVNQLVAKAGGLREDAYLGRVHVVRFNPDGTSRLIAYSLDSVEIDSIALRPRDNVILYSVKDMNVPDSVQITGAIFKPGRYEFREGITAKDLVMEAGGYLPHHETGRILIFRGSGREQKIEQIALEGEEDLAKKGPGFKLNRGDMVQIPVDPRWYQKEIVTLEGLFLHPGKYALLYPGESISSVVARAGGFKENAYVHGGRFFRSRDSVGRIGVDIARAIRNPRSSVNIGLMGGDSIFIPERLNTVKVIGEVGFETSVLLKEGAPVSYYIENAGGFTRRSERDRVVVQYANGETSRDGYFNRKPDAGSVIYVPQGPEPKPIDWVSGLNAVLGTTGVVVALILSVQALTKN